MIPMPQGFSYDADIREFSQPNEFLGELRGLKHPTLNGQGFITLVDVMGSDASIAKAARTSFGKLKGKDDESLLKYLLRHQHTTPFETAEVLFLIEAPMDCWRQWIRHRTANVNEYSTRYVPAIDRAQKTKPSEWRAQATDNKQGSDGFIKAEVGYQLTQFEEDLQMKARHVYEQRLQAGVAKEQARKDLPLSTFTRAVWKCDLHNIFNFLRLRMDGHAQAEIREYANAMMFFIERLFPVSTNAFKDYVLNAVKLTLSEQEIIRRMFLLVYRDYLCLSRETQFTRDWIQEFAIDQAASDMEIDECWRAERCRERDEFFAKLVKLGMLKD